MQYIERKYKKVSYDLNSIEVGESIFSKADDNTFYLCIKRESNFEIYAYHDEKAVFFGEHEEPSLYIYPDNEVFNKDKTESVYKMWKDVITCQYKISEYEYQLGRRFLY